MGSCPHCIKARCLSAVTEGLSGWQVDVGDGRKGFGWKGCGWGGALFWNYLHNCRARGGNKELSVWARRNTICRPSCLVATAAAVGRVPRMPRPTGPSRRKKRDINNGDIILLMVTKPTFFIETPVDPLTGFTSSKRSVFFST